MSDGNIYSDLYELALNKMEGYREFSLSKDSFQMLTEMEGGKLDVLKISCLPDKDFLLASYYGIFREMPSVKEIQELCYKAGGDRGRILVSLVTSEKYKKYGRTVLQNNIYE